jgi:hypothetical protein
VNPSQKTLIIYQERSLDAFALLGVAACKHKRSGLQTSQFSAQIKGLPQF